MNYKLTLTDSKIENFVLFKNIVEDIQKRINKDFVFDITTNVGNNNTFMGSAQSTFYNVSNAIIFLFGIKPNKYITSVDIIKKIYFELPSLINRINMCLSDLYNISTNKLEDINNSTYEEILDKVNYYIENYNKNINILYEFENKYKNSSTILKMIKAKKLITLSFGNKSECVLFTTKKILFRKY